MTGLIILYRSTLISRWRLINNRYHCYASSQRALSACTASEVFLSLRFLPSPSAFLPGYTVYSAASVTVWMPAMLSAPIDSSAPQSYRICSSLRLYSRSLESCQGQCRNQAQPLFAHPLEYPLHTDTLPLIVLTSRRIHFACSMQ